MGVLAARIAHLPRRGVSPLLHARDDLATDGTILVARVNKIEEIGRDGQGQFVMLARTVPSNSSGRQRGQEALQFLQRRNAVLKLPLPIIPIGIGDIAPEASAGRMEFFQAMEKRRVGFLWLRLPLR